MNTRAGCRVLEITDDRNGVTAPVIVMYPTESPEVSEPLGPYTVSVAMNAPPAAQSSPLIVISHGTGGSPLVYRELAVQLARNGFVVAMLEHPGNNRHNDELSGTIENLRNRPRFVSLVIDRLFASHVFGPCLKAGNVAIIGHSMGGYTALAAAGGRPVSFPWESADRQPRQIEVNRDERLKALVLFAPATAWFMTPGALQDLRVPVLMLTAANDPYTPAWHGELVKHGVSNPQLVEHRTIANAGHFSFLSPFPESMSSAGFAPSQDPPGFDRVRFHEEMNAEVLAFLQRTLFFL